MIVLAGRAMMSTHTERSRNWLDRAETLTFPGSLILVLALYVYGGYVFWEYAQAIANLLSCISIAVGVYVLVPCIALQCLTIFGMLKNRKEMEKRRRSGASRMGDPPIDGGEVNAIVVIQLATAASLLMVGVPIFFCPAIWKLTLVLFGTVVVFDVIYVLGILWICVDFFDWLREKLDYPKR